MDESWLRKRHTTFIVFTIQVLFLGCDYSITLVNLWIYLTKMVKPDTPTFLYSIISVVYLLSAAIGAVVVGRIADRTRSVRLLFFVANILLIVGNIFYMLPFSYWYLLVGRVLAGSGHGIRAVITGEIARCYNGNKLLKKFTVIGSAHAIGFTSAPAINILVQSFHARIGKLEITFANASGLYMPFAFFLSQLLAFCMVHDLSKEYDLKKDTETYRDYETTTLLNETDKCIEEDNEEDDLENIENNCINLKEKGLENGDNNELYGSHSVIWLLRKLFSSYDTSLLLILQFTETFFIYSFDMCQPLILINILRWPIFDYNLLVFGAGVMVIIPCFVFIFLKVSDKTTYYLSVFGVFSYCVLQAIQIIWTKKLLSSAGNVIISIVYVLFWTHAAYMRDVFITGFLARMVSTYYQSTVDGIRLGLSKIGAVIALLTSSYALMIIDRIGVVYIIIQAIIGLFIISRHKTLMNPKVIIS